MAVNLINRLGVLHMSPTWTALDRAARDAFNTRVAGCDGDITRLPDADRDLIRQGTLEVSAGKAPLVQNPAEWGDWVAIDAAIDSGDLDQLDAALDTVGLTDGGGLRWDPTARSRAALPAATDDDFTVDGTEAELADDTEAKDLPGPDDTGWVGL